ncbi:arsinothricin resistance N-acetyltransferase ArsN1 family B [Colwellia sp. 12G3]|uniref:arsinothricin resistance N-acetyltransferase ArsN1 family B n=1 Tax=Colwellia sp. 12G3 TaxID=2058299 RepID=UPI000C323E1F|nr:arsinothricin resistance N-acetyltransferase ArsN1 family B [Colwellia sp. 12G3]PKI15973.1 phosphinothricin acetyltransferase [Colwellia sp. 12G3]
MIRVVQDNDAEAICDIYNHYITNTVITFEEQTITSADMLSRITNVLNAELPWLVVEDETGNVVGYAYAAKWRERFSYRFSVEVTVYLSPEHGKKGFGSQLYRALFDKLKALGIHSVIGGITLPNAASVALHEKLGMDKVAHFKEVGLKFDRWLDVGYWQATL